MGHFTRTESVTIHHRRDGSAGPAMLLFNGASLPLEFWDPVVEALAGEAVIIRFDHRSAGRSRFEGSFSLADVAADAAAVLDAEAVEQAMVVGHAWGGRAAQVFARDYPHRTRALAVLGTGGQLPANLTRDDTAALRAAAASSDRDRWERHLERCYCARGFRSRESAAFTAMADLLWHQRPHSAARWDPRICPSASYWGVASTPTLLLYGTEDRNGTPANARDLASRVAQGRLVMIEQAGHFLVREQPRRVAVELREFMGNLERGEHG